MIKNIKKEITIKKDIYTLNLLSNEFFSILLLRDSNFFKNF